MENPGSSFNYNFIMNELVPYVLNKIPYDIPFIKIYIDDLLFSIPVKKKRGFSKFQQLSSKK